MMWRVLSLIAVTALGAMSSGMPARAQPDNLPKVEARFVAEHAQVAPGSTVTVALHQVIRKDWHTYWRNPGDSGAPTRIAWQLPAGWQAGEIQWPYPHRIPIGPLMNFGYADEVALLVDITVPADAVIGETIRIPADVDWLVCSDVCIPESAKLDLTLNVAAAPSPAQETELFARARAALPREAPWQVTYQAGDARFGMLIHSAELASANPREVAFFPVAGGLVMPAAEQRIRATPDGLSLESAPGPELESAAKRDAAGNIEGVLVLTGVDGRTDAFAVTAEKGIVPAAPESGLGLVQAMLLAFLGGLILNLMPCVLPVLSMKALALAKNAHGPREARAEALAYGGGVLVTFLSLAALLIVLREGGQAAGWGFQLQQPIFVAGLALLMFAVGLNLSGLYEFNIGRLAGAGQNLASSGGATGSFFTGMLAVVVATPCTAPFMAAAIGFAATQSAAVALSVFFALAVGFAAPFVLVGVSPALLRRLPRPGTWMDVFKQVLAFPMYGAAIWLIWVLSQQTGPDGLFAVLGAGLALAFAFWAYGISQRAQRSGFGRIAAIVGLVLAVALTAMVGRSQPAQASRASAASFPYEPYSATRLAELRGAGKAVFVNATAAWCITCLVNERVALSGGAIGDAFTKAGVVALKADWTNQNPEITALLSQYGRSGVPLYIYVPPGGEPKVLPQLLTESIVLAAMDSKPAL